MNKSNYRICFEPSIGRLHHQIKMQTVDASILVRNFQNIH